MKDDVHPLFQLNTQRSRSHRGIDFCYLCGEPLTKDRNRDHVPPKGIFTRLGRTDPIILPTHPGCNSNFSDEDERIAQLLKLQRPEEYDWKDGQIRIDLEVESLDDQSGELGALIKGVNFPRSIQRWVKAMHAILYREPLCRSTRWTIQTPLAAATLDHDGRARPLAPVIQYAAFAATINRRIRSGASHGVQSHAGEFRYDCVWTHTDDGRPVCIFAMRVHDWELLGETETTGRRGCVGCYFAPAPAAVWIQPQPIFLEFLAMPFDPYWGIVPAANWAD